MTKTYIAKYGHTDEAIPGTLELAANSDSAAIEEVREFVGGGYINGTWANVQLSDGRMYCCKNNHGDAVGSYV